MSEFTAINKLTRVPGLRRKRVRIWAAVVLSIVLVLGIQAAVPDWCVGVVTCLLGILTFAKLFW